MDDAEMIERDVRSPGPADRTGAPGLILAGALILAIVFGSGMLVGRALTPADGGIASDPSPIAAASAQAPTTAPTGTATPRPASDAPSPPGSIPPLPSSSGPSPTTGPSDGLPSAPPGAPADFGLFWEALALVQERYVDRGPLAGTELTYSAIRGLVDGLGDTGHSVFLTPEELAAERAALEGRLTGIGALLGERGGSPIIVSVISGTPADQAGLRSGDRILAVDGQRTDRLDTQEIVALVRGDAGTEVILTVVHPGQDEAVQITVVRAVIEVPAVTWAMVPGTVIADVRLIQFSAGAAEALTAALDEAIAEGAEAVVLDLRSDPGGLVDEAVGVASQFLPEDTVVYQRQDSEGITTPVPARADGVATELPLAVLVDQGTASSAEIVAGAIGDADRALIIGERTFGTGTVLNTFELTDGSAVRLGVEHWLTPSGELIFENGITPDEEIELPAEGLPLEPDDLADMDAAEFAASGDSQLLRAVEVLESELAP